MKSQGDMSKIQTEDKMQATEEAQPEFPFDLVRPHIEQVEEIIAEQARAFDPGVEGYISYICESAGKRIRPALAALTAGALADGKVLDSQVRLGATLELVHIASLVHDDLMDEADTRRGLMTASTKWGSSLSVLLGDSLFSHALMMATEFDDIHLSREVARASREVCEGEILQTQRRFDLELSIPEYYHIIELKTAALFGAATELSAYLGGASKEVQAALKNFGRKLGTAYQLYDDCLDLVGDPEAAGKTLRTDLEKGKLTLPILNLIGAASDSQREKLGRLLLEREPLDLNVIAGIADYEGALEAAVGEGHRMLDECRQDLICLPSNESSKALGDIVDYLGWLFDSCLR